MSKEHFVNIWIVLSGCWCTLLWPTSLFMFLLTPYIKKKKANKLLAILLNCYNQMSHAHISMFPWTTGQRMNKLTCHSRWFKGQNRILLSIERVGESNTRPCIQSASLSASISMATGSSLSPFPPSERSRLVCNSSWQALQLWAALAFLQRTSSRSRGRNCHVCWLVIRSQSHPESWGLKLNYTLLLPIKQCTSSLAFYLKYNPVPWTLSRLSEWWHLTTSHTQCQIGMTFTGNVRKGAANYY